MDLTEQQRDELHALEEAMWVAETRGDPDWFDAQLAPNFTEHGASGKVWDRQSITTTPISGEIPVELPLPHFCLREIAPTVVLITYVSIVDGNASNRASIWRHNGVRWLMEFHQGTPTTLDHYLDS